MFPEKEIALHELDIAGGMNPGPWTAHSQNVAKAAQLIAQSAGMDGEKATDVSAAVNAEALGKGIVIKKGKKVYHRITL